jgi:hypothetical protein
MMTAQQKEGVPVEEEARRILTKVVSSSDSLSRIFSQYFGAKHGIDFQISHKPHEPIKL